MNSLFQLLNQVPATGLSPRLAVALFIGFGLVAGTVYVQTFFGDRRNGNYYDGYDDAMQDQWDKRRDRWRHRGRRS